MSIEAPRRLKDDPQLGDALRAAEQAPISAERIASNGEAIKAAILAGARTLSFWKVLLPILLVGGGAFIGYRELRRQPPPQPVAATTPSLARDAGVPVDAEAVATVEPEVAPDAAVVAIVDKPKRPAPRTEPAIDAAVADVAIATPPASELPEQIQLYEAARTAGARGAFAEGLAKLDDLLQRFPSTQLRPDAELTRAELLVRANRLDDAVVALEALASGPSHRGRRGELLRTLGDVHRQRKDCRAALDAYARARSVTLSTADKAKVDRGIEACAAPR